MVDGGRGSGLDVERHRKEKRWDVHESEAA